MRVFTTPESTMRNLTKTFFLTTLLAVGGLALAGPDGGHHQRRGGHGPGHAFMKVVKDLDLTEAQRTQIREIVSEGREDRRGDKDERKAHMAAFKAELLSDAPNTKTLHQMADDAQAARQAKMHERIDDMVAVSQILTPEQRAQASERMDAMQAEMEARHEQRGEQRGERHGQRR